MWIAARAVYLLLLCEKALPFWIKAAVFQRVLIWMVVWLWSILLLACLQWDHITEDCTFQKGCWVPMCCSLTWIAAVWLSVQDLNFCVAASLVTQICWRIAGAVIKKGRWVPMCWSLMWIAAVWLSVLDLNFDVVLVSTHWLVCWVALTCAVIKREALDVDCYDWFSVQDLDFKAARWSGSKCAWTALRCRRLRTNKSSFSNARNVLSSPWSLIWHASG